ncbi:uncharacterized protein SETTUDRAFT_90128, partial [Exserohilum turcica Et28A]
MSTCTDFARSKSTKWSPPLPITSELEALRQLKTEWTRHSGAQTTHDKRDSKKRLLIVDLHDFEVYRSPDHYKRAYELMSLHLLELPVSKRLCFDGFVRLGNVHHYIQGVPIQDSSIEGYGDDQDPKITAYIRSELANNDPTYDIWYRLKEPTLQYRRFHDPFLWVAQLGKHVIDYMEVSLRSLNSFRSNFHLFLMERFRGHRDFEQWHAAFRNQSDFRVAVNAYIDYFFNQAYNLPNSEHLLDQPIWTDCMAKALTNTEPQADPQPTLATPHVYACFRDTYFGKQMQEMRPSSAVQTEKERRKRKLGFAKSRGPPASFSVDLSNLRCQPYGSEPVAVSDIIAYVPNETDTKVWRDTRSDWLAYVQRTKRLDNGVQRLFVLWIYRHYDTHMAKATYPFQNEVFLSDHCNCTGEELLSTEIKGKYDVDWSPKVIDSKRIFIRQTYNAQESAFVTVKDEHKTCRCQKERSTRMDMDNYRSGDTVYLQKSLHNQDILEPVIIQGADVKGSIIVRKLLRLGRDCAKLAKQAHRFSVASNELILTDAYEEAHISQIQRRCSIHFVPRLDVANDQIPFPYNRGGAGDFWFISMGLTRRDGKRQLIFLRQLPQSVKQCLEIGIDRKLRGISIFSGGGSLDRGLEDGGAVEFHTAIDTSLHAIRTQQANIKDSVRKKFCPYCGSVNDFLHSALEGGAKGIVRVGEVDMISAGCPCIAFSSLQKNPLGLQSLYNASLVSTFCSFVDLYRPLYGVFENVIDITSTSRGGVEVQNIFAQVVASLVSMGYQVNQCIMDAWNFGSPQQRSRLIVTIAAPGLSPIEQAWHTHGTPENTKQRSLGVLPSGVRYGGREHYPTPFDHVPASTVGLGLPNIGNGLTQTCIPYPDHRVPNLPTWQKRDLLKYIPRQPPGCGYKEAEERGLIPPHLQIIKDEERIGKSYRRIKAAGLVPTITTGISVGDAQNGANIHSHEPRTISLLDARRTQGWSDEEPIIGTLRDQYRIVGNGVDRKVAFAVGLGLLRAVE